MSFVVPTKSEQPTEKTRLICRSLFEKQKPLVFLPDLSENRRACRHSRTSRRKRTPAAKAAGVLFHLSE